MNMALFPDVVVNGETIPSAAIAAEAQNHSAPKDKPGIAWRKAAQALAIRTLLLQEARARGLAADPEELSPGRVETEDEALIRALLDEALTIAPVTEEAIRAEWARDPGRYRSAPLWDVSHILCACDPRDDAESAMAGARAKAMLVRLDGDAKGFASAARESDCGSKAARRASWPAWPRRHRARVRVGAAHPDRRRHDARPGPVAAWLAHHPPERHRPGAGAAL
jgi:peptidyl-prolyl cis-trans isomerase C